MRSDVEIERLLEDWLEDEARMMPHDVLEIALESVARTRQGHRRRPGPVWLRSRPMGLLAAATVLILVVVAGGLAVGRIGTLIPPPRSAYGFAGRYTATDCATWWRENPDGSHDIDCSKWGDDSLMTLDIGRGSNPRVVLVDSYASSCADADLPTRFVSVGQGAFVDASNLELSFTDTFCGNVVMGDGGQMALYGPNPTMWNDPDGDGWGIVWYPVH